VLSRRWFVSLIFLGLPTVAQAQLASLTQNFDDVPSLQSAGWNFQNNSQSADVTRNWFQGQSAPPFNAQAGPDNSYLGANFEFALATENGGSTINGWALTPQLNFSQATLLSFYARTVSVVGFPDRLQVRLSTAGASTNVGTGFSAGTVGDFTTLLLDINPTYDADGFPTSWEQQVINIPAQAGNGRIAFRYFVEDGGPAGSRSDFIGIDTLNFAVVPEPTGLLALGGIAVGGWFVRRRRC
jgi:hypothetical protein